MVSIARVEPKAQTARFFRPRASYEVCVGNLVMVKINPSCHLLNDKTVVKKYISSMVIMNGSTHFYSVVEDPFLL